ncbi:MAG: transglycosylase domain-containing protein [Gammaproteobacteria bacterium]
MQINRVLVGILLLGLATGVVVSGIVLTVFVKEEVHTSKYQARYLSEISKQLDFKLEPGASTSIRYPEYGPYDQRLGYTSLPETIVRLQKAGFNVTAQASSSPMMVHLVDNGLFNIYQEKTQAGLRIVDQGERVIFSNLYPYHGYSSFVAIPPLVLYTLLFIENRELLDDSRVTINPAVEWDRLGFAGLQMVANKLGVGNSVPGGSTLATQIEKYRHSKSGYTHSVVDKFRQMSTASVRAYLLGPDTREMRREIALSYLNSMPLSATPKAGEVHGLGDGLVAWFGADFDEVNRLLSSSSINSGERVTEEQAVAYRQVLSVLLSQRRPSYFLGHGFDDLQQLADSYLRLLANQGVISNSLRDAALKASAVRPKLADPAPSAFLTEKKTQAVLRARLAKTLNVKTIYDLDRLDLTVKTTLDYEVQQAVTAALRRLSDPDQARSAGILGFRLLNDNVKLDSVIYSLMLFERSDSGNLLRVQTDNFDQPLDINEGIKLDLGSTSKLRSMVHYLELVTDVYRRYKDRSASELKAVSLHPRDYISAWVIGQLRIQPQINLEDLLNMALDRRFSASPGEYFFTGGGLHHFNNFDKSENSKIMSVRHALRDSVNLVFIRLMREIVYHHLYNPEGLARWLDDPEDPRHKEYLARFADNEGRVYLRRFFARYQGKSEEEALAMLVKRVKSKASRLTMLYRAVYPDRDWSRLNEFLSAHLNKAALAKEDVYGLFERYSIEKFDLQDQGFITKIHPLELWLVGYLSRHPDATREEVMAASESQRQEVYRWLLKSKRKSSQQRRIMILLETEAFKKIHEAWRRVGYPFGRLTPSYATSIGASGDRPVALAELLGIIQNDGVKMPIVRFDRLHYAEGTPYETLLDKAPDQGERVFASEIARVARGALIGVVEGGTATRLRGAYTDATGKPLAIGGKTGTGDHRQQVWGEGRRLIASKFISRAATFAFFLGDRFFGVMTAYVAGDEAEKYHFTSSLPVQIVKFLNPVLTPLLNRPPASRNPADSLSKVAITSSSGDTIAQLAH